jgi:hypothetical protein
MSFIRKLFQKEKEVPGEGFWTWFKGREEIFFRVLKSGNELEEKFLTPITKKLEAHQQGIYFLAGMDSEDQAELIFTADGSVPHIVLVEELVAEAPKFSNWKFTAHKQGMETEDMMIRMDEFEFHEGNIHFYEEDLPGMPDEVAITVVHDQWSDANQEEITRGIYIFLENYLGDLAMLTQLDDLQIGAPDASRTAIPVNKLKDYLTWREKEFVEKYDGTFADTANSPYTLGEANLEDGSPVVAVFNSDLMNWDAKSSHPWMAHLELNYDGSTNNGLPLPDDFEILSAIEEKLNDLLKDSDGYLNVARETASNTRHVYIACKEFRKPSKTLHELSQSLPAGIEMSFAIYRDKYWRSLDRFGELTE